MPTRHGLYTLSPDLPTAAVYRRLRADAGLTPRTEEQAARALEGSWAFRGAWTAQGELAAMGRIVGDGGWYFVVADMATHPDHQRRGVGAAILDALVAEIRDRAPAGAYVGLTADPPGRRLYESRGFADVAPAATGMRMVEAPPAPSTIAG